jgi:dihydroxyacetone kinase
MKDRLNSEDLIFLFRKVRKDIILQNEILTNLDAAVGDGDLGVTIILGMNAIEEGVQKLEVKDIGTFLIQSGMNFNRAASSTFGTVIMAALVGAGKVVLNKTEIDGKDIIRMLEEAESAIKKIGKAQIGNKTVLDALDPMKEAFEKAIGFGETLERALRKACEAAEQGVENTKKMKSEIGRGKWLGDRSLGHADPGAVALLMMMRSFLVHLREIENNDEAIVNDLNQLT